MSFLSYIIKDAYRSDEGNIVDQFYLPVLNKSIEYNRAVGYFTSSSLAMASKGITALIKNGGRMNLIASPQLDEKDVEAIKKGYEKRELIIKEAALKELKRIDNNIVKRRLEFLAWLVAENRLDIKFAIVKKGRGIYHEKFGILKDKDGNVIAFSGSPNETVGGIYSNFESIDVFRSWVPGEEQRVKNKSEYFDNLWNDRTKLLEIINFSDADKRELFKEVNTHKKPLSDPESDDYNRLNDLASDMDIQYSEKNSNSINQPAHIKLFPYQKDAISAWFENKARGFLKMATGTGKTITALSATTILRRFLKDEDDTSLTTLVVCPYRHLVTQWYQNARGYGYKPIKCFESKHKWDRQLSSAITAVNAGAKDDLFIIATNSTFAGSAFQNIIKNIRKPLLIIVDEAHNIGSKKLQNYLPDFAEFRLGLSATPERWFDDEGTQRLYEYFGEPVFEYGLKEAIKNGFLTEYNYYPVLVPLTDSELYEYLEISKRISVLSQTGKFDLDDENNPVNKLLIERARITSSAKNKIEFLKKELLSNKIDSTYHNLIYCGDGSVDTETQEYEVRQIEAVTKLLGNELNMLVSTYVAETSTEMRENLLDNFAKGNIQALVAIRCLDEGVDVPITKRAFILASSSNPRQFIQRRGRVLRKSDGKDVAEIWDFIVLPPFEAIEDGNFNIERKLVERELKRVVEFTELANNGPQANEKLMEVKKHYNLTHL